ncbi:TetR/AcrR family transcriptional regulator [Photobacterium leiognathi]|uniref:TetR/AcrR family transcriptional regulator n=1 Tax=Photobacterium leiognathi TaxID=553611 RepID=UPI002738956D|nr:TetR/AcrR family transcriptional regulator [Photobacterium leiognathi]
MNDRSFISHPNIIATMNEKKQRILAAAEKLLAELGFHGLSMQMVAKEANVAAGTIYRYFNDKEDLLNQLHDHILSYIAAQISHNIVDSMPIKQRYRTMWLNLWHMTINGDAPLVIRGQFQSLPCQNKQDRIRISQKLFSPVATMFNDGKACGLFKDLDNEVLSVLSLETSCSLARRQIHRGLEISDDEIEAVINASWDAITLH